MPGPPPPRANALRGLRTALVVLLAVAGLFAVLAAIQLFHRASLVDDFDQGFGSLREIDDADSTVAGLAGFLILLVIATGVVWIVWQARHSTNAGLLGRRGGLGVGWAIGGWFVPLGNFVLPVAELHQSSKPSDPAFDPNVPNSGRADTLVVPWGIVWGLGWALFWYGRVTRPSDDEIIFGDRSLGDFATADRVSGIAGLCIAAAAVFAIAVVVRLSARQEEKLKTAIRPGYPTPGGYPPQGYAPQGYAPQPQGYAPPASAYPPPVAPPPTYPPPPANPQAPPPYQPPPPSAPPPPPPPTGG